MEFQLRADGLLLKYLHNNLTEEVTKEVTMILIPPPDEPAPRDKEREETKAGHDKSVVIHRPESQKENSTANVSSENNNPSNQEDSGTHLSSSVRKGRQMCYSCGMCYSCSSALQISMR